MSSNEKNERSSGNGDGGSTLIKKLLFPSYIEAGSNQTFQAPSNNPPTHHIMTDHENDDVHVAVHDGVSPTKNSASSASSSSSRRRKGVLQPHDMEYDGSQIGGYAPQPLRAEPPKAKGKAPTCCHSQNTASSSSSSNNCSNIRSTSNSSRTPSTKKDECLEPNDVSTSMETCSPGHLSL